MTSSPQRAPRRAASASVAVPAARAARPPAVVPRASAHATRCTASFEGGQTPLLRRLPKLKGFNNPFRVEYQAVNLHTLNDLVEKVGADITPDVLVANGIVRKGAFVKILARGEITTKVNVSAHGASAAAKEAIEAAGGSITMITLPFKEEGKAGRPASSGNQFMNR